MTMPDLPVRTCARGQDQSPPVIVAWGASVDSTAMTIEMAARGDRIDIVVIADTRSTSPGAVTCDARDHRACLIGYSSMAIVASKIRLL